MSENNDGKTVVAYKGFDAKWQCRRYQYEVGKTYTHEGDVNACSSGFHSCENPFDVWGYYNVADSKFALVEVGGKLSRHDSDSKIASASITIKAELKLPEFIQHAINYVMKLCKVDMGVPAGELCDGGKAAAQIGSSGNAAQIGSSGNDARIGSSGYAAQIGSSGYAARIGSSGNAARIGSSGNAAQIGSSGYAAQIGSSGNAARIEATGENAVIAAAGSVVSVKVGVGAAICIPYWDGKRTRFAVGYVGESLKSNTAYRVDGDGQFVEVA